MSERCEPLEKHKDKAFHWLCHPGMGKMTICGWRAKSDVWIGMTIPEPYTPEEMFQLGWRWMKRVKAPKLPREDDAP